MKTRWGGEKSKVTQLAVIEPEIGWKILSSTRHLVLILEDFFFLLDNHKSYLIYCILKDRDNFFTPENPRSNHGNLLKLHEYFDSKSVLSCYFCLTLVTQSNLV